MFYLGFTPIFESCMIAKKICRPVFAWILFFATASFAQTIVKGKIIDAASKQSLAFVTVIEKGTNNGVLSDIDGKFQLTLHNNNPSSVLMFSYLGYQKKEVLLRLINAGFFVVELDNLGINLNEVVVNPGVNPAIRIMKLVAKNADVNNPQKMSSFSYHSYNKMFVTSDVEADEDSVRGYNNSNKDAMRNFFSKQHLFLTESVSKRDFLFPSYTNEIVLASRVSGFKAAPFTLLATQMQSFSFYDDWVNVFDVNYLNPIAPVAIKKYTYTLEDTLFNKSDTIYIISFKPKEGKNFKALKGTLYINTNRYAVQNVIAEPAEADQQISIKIQQKYEFIEEKQWFPVQLNTDWIYNNIALKENKSESATKMKAVSRSYVKNIILNPSLSKKQFSEVEISIDDSANKKNDDFWKEYRVDSLTTRDEKTYQLIDSIGEKKNFDKKIIAMEALFTGEIPIGSINLKLNELYTYNAYEGSRFGLGLKTNQKLSSAFSIGAYGAYGMQDKAWKYGANADVRLWKKKELFFETVIKKDVLETGAILFNEKTTGFTNSEQLRTLSVYSMDKFSLLQAGFSFRFLNYFKSLIYANYQQRVSKYSYNLPENHTTSEINTYTTNEIGIKIKFLFREKFMQTLRSKIAMGSNYPVVYFNVGKGFKTNQGNLENFWNYFKAELKINYSYKVSTYGKQNICLLAGKLVGDMPYSFNYSAFGNNYYKIGAASEHCFETMLPNEFINNQFAALFFAHNFGRFLKPSQKFNPELEIVHSMGIGACNNTTHFLNVAYRTMEKGFFESGIKLNCLIKSAFSGIGIGVFYRYGKYALDIPINNFALKITFGFSLN